MEIVRREGRLPLPGGDQLGGRRQTAYGYPVNKLSLFMVSSLDDIFPHLPDKPDADNGGKRPL